MTAKFLPVQIGIRSGDLNRDGRLDLVAPSELGLWVFFNEGYR